jgi:uncharacterized cupin superfamily protein
MSEGSEGSVVAESVMNAPLGPAPIPDEDIVAGEPKGSTAVLRSSDDKRLNNGVWECTPGKFYLPHNYEETVTVISGRVTVTPEGGEPLELGPGDTAFFPAGTRVLWEVHETLRKSWHIYDSDGSLFADPGD